MKRQHARLTATEQEVMRLRTDGHELSPATKRKAAQQASDDLDAAIERDLRRSCDCCDRPGWYSGQATCPKHCPCHD